MTDETAWLIEQRREEDGVLFYYGMSDNDLETSTLSWTQGATKAIRFSRKQDALTVLNHTRWMNLGRGAVVAEHMWCGPKVTESENGTAVIHAAVNFIMADINKHPTLNRENAIQIAHNILYGAVMAYRATQPSKEARSQ